MNDREKLVELLATAPFEPFVGVIRTIGSQFTPLFIGNIADHLIANGVTFATGKNDGGKWIPVTERLPVCGERVLVLVDSCAVFEAYLGISHKWVRYGSFWIDGVTHWMPLPEPPEGE